MRLDLRVDVAVQDRDPLAVDRRVLLNDFGDKPLKVTSVEYRHGIKRYRDYTAYKQLMLTIDDGSGNAPEQMKIGSIAEVNGEYKFISYVRD